MKPFLRTSVFLVIFVSVVFTFAPLAFVSAQTQTASIRFTAQITPSAGLAEPIRGLPFYLLRKSFTDIQAEAEASQPKPDMEKFIDAQKVSKELKAWMHKHHSVTLSGEEFAKHLSAEEILEVPEFWQAYDQMNIGDKKFGFPVPKYDDRLRAHNPEKYQREKEKYHEKILKYINENPDSKQGMDAELNSIDPSAEWNSKVAARRAAIRRTALDWAQSRYIVAQTQTDLNGHAEFRDVPAGSYWISTLNIEGQVGDMRAKWDVPVVVTPGAAMQTVLSNYNSVPAKSAL